MHFKVNSCWQRESGREGNRSRVATATRMRGDHASIVIFKLVIYQKAGCGCHQILYSIQGAVLSERGSGSRPEMPLTSGSDD